MEPAVLGFECSQGPVVSDLPFRDKMAWQTWGGEDANGTLAPTEHVLIDTARYEQRPRGRSISLMRLLAL